MKFVDPAILFWYDVKSYLAKIMGLDVGIIRTDIAFYELGLNVQPPILGIVIYIIKFSLQYDQLV